MKEGQTTNERKKGVKMQIWSNAMVRQKKSGHLYASFSSFRAASALATDKESASMIGEGPLNNESVDRFARCCSEFWAIWLTAVDTAGLHSTGKCRFFGGSGKQVNGHGDA